MSRSAKTYIAGVYEHSTRKAIEKTIPQFHAELAVRVLEDAGLRKEDVDSFFCDGTVPGLGGISLAECLGLKFKYMDCTETGGSSYAVHVGHAPKLGEHSIEVLYELDYSTAEIEALKAKGVAETPTN